MAGAAIAGASRNRFSATVAQHFSAASYLSRARSNRSFARRRSEYVVSPSFVGMRHYFLSNARRRLLVLSRLSASCRVNSSVFSMPEKTELAPESQAEKTICAASLPPRS